jgi:hypothetical protein
VYCQPSLHAYRNVASIGHSFLAWIWELPVMNKASSPALLLFCLSLSVPALAISSQPSVQYTSQDHSVLESTGKCCPYAAHFAMGFFRFVVNLVNERPLFAGIITALHLIPILIPYIIVFRKKQFQVTSEISGSTGLGKGYKSRCLIEPLIMFVQMHLVPTLVCSRSTRLMHRTTCQ